VASSDLIQISEGEAFSLHNYFHVCPESPNGERVAYTRYPDGPHDSQSGPAEVIVCDRNGEDQRCVGKVDRVTQHRGACPTWIDDLRLVYATKGDGEGSVCVVDVETGNSETYVAGLDNYSPALNRIYFHGEHEGQPAVSFLDLNSGERHVAVTMDRMAAFAVKHGYAFQPEALAHSYISPGGDKIAFRVGREPEMIIMLADPDGDNLKMFGLKMMHWQFFDDTSLFGHDDVFVKDRYMRRWDLSGNILEVLSGPGCHGTISPDRNWVVTEAWYGSDPVPIFLYRRGEIEPTATLATSLPPWSTRAHVHPTFSRDGRRVYFNLNTPQNRGSQVMCCDLGQWIDK
jgi:hypothetical protein